MIFVTNLHKARFGEGGGEASLLAIVPGNSGQADELPRLLTSCPTGRDWSGSTGPFLLLVLGPFRLLNVGRRSLQGNTFTATGLPDTCPTKWQARQIGFPDSRNVCI